MILQTLQEEFKETLERTAHSTVRSYAFPEAEGLIKVAIGMRRSGKTYFLFQTIRLLLSQGVLPNRILYLNFEDDRILPMNQKEMGEMVDSWYSLYPENHSHRCYLFLDEVRNIEGWALVLRRMQDTKDVQIYVTGSSAKLLSSEIATSLRGRSLAIEIFPYNYLEYLVTHHLERPTNSFGKKMLDCQREYLVQYFQRGGFPGVQSLQINEHRETLQNYVETVVFRDIVERYQITNISLLKYLIFFLLKNVGAPFSVNKFYNDIKSQGYQVGKDTLYTYLTYLEDAFLVFMVPLFTKSLRQGKTSPKKVYAVDNGLIQANSFSLSGNFGRLLENQVYLDLRRKKKKVFYYHTADGYEIDFVTQDSQGQYELFQIVWDASDPKTLEREQRALDQAKNELGVPGELIDLTEYLQKIL